MPQQINISWLFYNYTVNTSIFKFLFSYLWKCLQFFSGFLLLTQPLVSFSTSLPYDHHLILKPDHSYCFTSDQPFSSVKTELVPKSLSPWTQASLNTLCSEIHFETLSPDNKSYHKYKVNYDFQQTYCGIAPKKTFKLHFWNTWPLKKCHENW